MIIATDIDGCLTTAQKALIQDGNELKIAKLFSDKDSYIIEKIKDLVHIIFVSGDTKINKQWAGQKEIDFISTPPGKDKWEHLSNYLESKQLNNSRFAYIGDSMPDFECLMHSDFAFVPNDVSFALLSKIANNKYNKNVVHLQRLGGHGVLEEVVIWLINNGYLPERIIE